MEKLKITGCNHKTASLAVREHIAFSSDNIKNAMASLHSLAGVEEALIFSTCNRTEICYSGLADLGAIQEWLADFHDFDRAKLKGCFYSYSAAAAMAHITRVASGLDSMVLGEPQVFGQLKAAWRMAKDQGYLKGPLDGILQRVFAVAKKVRSSTGLGRRPLSLAAIAVRLAEEQLGGQLKGRAALIVGAGHNASLIVRYLQEKELASICIANRTHDKARQLAQVVGGSTIPLMDIAEYLGAADMVFTSTSCPTKIITKDMVAKTMESRSRTPLFIADLSVPRDVESSVKELAQVSFFIMDDLQELVRANEQYRNQEAAQAQRMIDAEFGTSFSSSESFRDRLWNSASAAMEGKGG